MKIISDGTIAETHFYNDDGSEIRHVVQFLLFGRNDMKFLVADLKVRVTSMELTIQDQKVDIIPLEENHDQKESNSQSNPA